MTSNAAMASVRLFFLLIVLAVLTMPQASAATYNLTPNNRPAICSGNQGSWSGNTYRCDWDQPFSLQQGDVIVSSVPITIHSNNGMNLTNVTLGSSTNPITLTAESGRTIQLNNSVLYSSIGGGSTQNVVLTNNTIVHGNISVSGVVQSTNSTVMGTITSSNGAVTITGGQAFGFINVQCCKVTVSGGAIIHAGIRAGTNGIEISNSTVTGDLTAGSNPIVLTNVTMNSGNISAGANNVTINGGDVTANVTNANNVTISNGAVVRGDVQARFLVEASGSTIYGDIETTEDHSGLHHVQLTNSTVYGNVTVRNDWGTITGNWPNSAIYGDCDYKSVTPSLCQAGPPPIPDPLWKFDEAQWTGSANQVLDSSVNLRHGRSRNGANTAISNPSPASCTYGDFQRGSSSSNNPYVDISRNSYFHGADNFSFSLWIRMNGADQPGSRQVILAYGADDGVNDEDDGRFELLRTSAGALRFAVRMVNEDLRYVETTGNVFNGQWHHVAVSYSKSNRRMRLYVDNVLLDDTPNEPIGNGNPSNTPNDGDEGLSIGALPNGSHGIKGQIDEVRFLNFELTAAQVAGYAGQTASCVVPEQCFVENFANAVNWYQTNLNSTPPSLQSSPSRLRLTTNAQNQSTSITFKRSFPAAGNRLTVEFDHYAYGGNGADGISLVLSDATQVPFPGSFGGSLGYAQRDNGNQGFRGGWLGVGFDEYGNYSLANEGRVGGFTGSLRPNTIGVRGAASSNYKWLAGTATLSPILQNGASFGRGDRYRVTLDSTSVSGGLFKLERRVSGQASYSTIINNQNLASLNQPAAPANLLLSFTGSTGSNTNFHELTNVQVCSVLPSVPIEIGNPIHHFRFSYNSGVTCQSNSVEVRACLNSDCSQLYTQPVSVTLAANNSASWPAGNTVNLTNGVGTILLAKTSTGLTALSLASSSVLPANPVQCRDTGVADSSCGVQFNDAALRFSAIANQIAGVWSAETNKLQIIETVPQTGVCAARVAPSTAVDLGYQCVDPDSCIAGQELRVRDTSLSPATNEIIKANNTGSNWLYQSTPLSFASAESDFALKYTDVGKVQLKARLVLAATSTQPTVTLEALSNEFVVRPDRIVVQSVSRTDGSSNPATTNTGEGFVAAGENFKVVLDVLNRDGNRTPNYGNEAIKETLALNSVLVYPLISGAACDAATSSCISNPAVSSGIGFVADQNFAGRFETSTASWMQVGSVQLNGKIADDNYLGAGNTASTNPTVLVGRFYPHHFTLTAAADSVKDSCEAGSFSYMGSATIELNATVQAFAADNTTVVTNYNSLNNKMYSNVAVFGLVAEQATSGTDLGSRLTPVSASWKDGRWEFVTTTADFARRTDLTPDGPYSDLQLGLKVNSEGDGRNFGNSALNMNAATVPDCTAAGNCTAVRWGNALDIRYGRLVLNGGNVADAAVAPIATVVPLEFKTEYWSGAAFVINANDNCTTISPASVSFDTAGLSVIGSGYSLNAGITGPTGLSATIPGGLTGLWPVFYQAPSWLKYNWQKESGTQVADNPSSEVSVGRYRGNKRQIFWQERLN